MLSKRLMTSACAAAMMLTISATPALAQGGPMDSRTEFTFNQPVELPGVTLPPGTYVFRFVDATTGRKVMQVQAKDASSKNVRDVHDDLGAASEAVRRRRAAFPRNARRPARRREDLVVSRQHASAASSSIRSRRQCVWRRPRISTVLTTQEANVSNDQMKTADLAYVSPSGQEHGADRRAAGRSRGEYSAGGHVRAAVCERVQPCAGSGRHDGPCEPATHQHPAGRNRPVGAHFAARWRLAAVPGVDWI